MKCEEKVRLGYKEIRCGKAREKQRHIKVRQITSVYKPVIFSFHSLV